MKFESREQRARVKAFWVALIPDTLIAFVVAVAFNGGLPVFFGALVFIWCVYLAIFLKKAIWSWVMFKAKHRKEISEQVFYHLKKNKFPEPRDNEESALGYLDRVMFDGGLPAELRMMAAYEYATLEGYKTRGEFLAAAKMATAFEDGIERYKAFFPDAESLSVKG